MNGKPGDSGVDNLIEFEDFVEVEGKVKIFLLVEVGEGLSCEVCCKLEKSLFPTWKGGAWALKCCYCSSGVLEGSDLCLERCWSLGF